METVDLIVLFFFAFLGGASVFFVKNGTPANLKLVLSFSGAYLFAITSLHLMPDVYSGGNSTVGLFVLAGFMLQVLMEQFSAGIEHGHMHRHHEAQPAFPAGIMISLSLHAFLEGMPIAQGEHNELVFGIALHHIPAAFALATVLLHSGVSKSMTVMYLGIFAAMSPLGYILSHSIALGSAGDISLYFDYIMALVIGMFLHISTTILFESSVDHKFNKRKLLAVLLGISIALAAYFAEG